MTESNSIKVTSKVSSKDISVFPVAKKRIADRMSDGLLYEDHIAAITSNIVDFNYIIEYSDEYSSGEDKKDKSYITFILDGYRIKISNFNTLVKEKFNSVSKIVAKLYFDVTNDDSIGVSELAGDSFESDVYVFNGVNLYGKDSIDYGDFVIAEVNADSTWQIPKGSGVKFSFDSLGIDGIDGKWQR